MLHLALNIAPVNPDAFPPRNNHKSGAGELGDKENTYACAQIKLLTCVEVKILVSWKTRAFYGADSYVEHEEGR